MLPCWLVTVLTERYAEGLAPAAGMGLITAGKPSPELVRWSLLDCCRPFIPPSCDPPSPTALFCPFFQPHFLSGLDSSLATKQAPKMTQMISDDEFSFVLAGAEMNFRCQAMSAISGFAWDSSMFAQFAMDLQSQDAVHVC